MPFGIEVMRVPAGLLLVLATAACQPAVPDQGVGFESYSSYMNRREAELAGAGGALPPAPPMAQAAVAPQFSTEIIGSAIDAAEAGPSAPVVAGPSLYAATDPNLPATRPRGNEPAGIQAQTGEVAAIVGGHASISDENDFNAVSARRTRESDAELIAQNRANYTVIPPQPLPQRQGDEGPNIVQFALSTSHMPGTQMFKRSSLRLKDPVSVCAQYGSPDLAQQAFLAAGGPDRDRKGLDPDGDGFACGWDPRPFRAVR